MPINKLSQLFVAVAIATATFGTSAQQTPVPTFTFKKHVPYLLINESTGEPAPAKKEPKLVFSAPELSFPATTVGSSSTQSLVLLNTGDGTAIIPPGFSIRDAGGPFSNLTTTCTNTLLPGNSCSVSLTFNSVDSDSYQGYLDLRTTNAGNTSILLAGLGTGAAVASLTPQGGYSNNFGLVELGSNKTQLFAFSNLGNATDRGVYASISGQNLVITSNTCGTSQSPVNLAKGSTCNIAVQYTPSSATSVAGQLTVASTAATGNKVLSLTGTGGQAVLDVSTDLVNFSNVELGSSSTQSFILLNTGNTDAPLNTMPAIVAGSASAFSDLSSSCGATLAAGATCVVSVKFSPVTVGTYTGSVEISSAKGGTKTVALSGAGTGHASSQFVAKPGSSLSFGNVAVGSSKISYFVFTNMGNINATNVHAEVTGEDLTVESSTCGIANAPVVIAPNNTCEIAVKFSPSKLGSLTNGQVIVNSTATEGVNTLQLNGNATGEPVASLAPSEGSSTNYGIVEVGQSKAQAYTYKNVGNIKDTNVYAYLTGSSDVSISNNTCGSSTATVELNPNQSCSFTATFAPTLKTNFVAAVNISSSATSGIKKLDLTAIAGKANLEVSASSVNYSTVEVGTSKNLSLVVLNSGDVTANITPAVALSAGSSGAFKNLTTSCGATLAVGATCSVAVDFTPASVGAHNAGIDIKTSNANNIFVELIGTGSGQPVSSLVPASGSSVDFGLVEVGKNKSQTFTYSNTGNISDAGVYVNLTGTYLTTTANSCGTVGAPVSISAGQSCSVTVKYAPTDTTAFAGNLKIESAATLGTKSLTLQGTVGYALLSTSTTAIAFNSVDVGSSATLGFTVQNAGNVPAALALPQLRAGSSSAFGNLVTNCSATLNAGDSCTVSVTFSPSVTGAVSGFVDVSANNASSKAVALNGTGAGQASANISLKPGYSADFGYVKVGASAYTEFVFKNTGNISATGVYPSIAGAGLAISANTCGTAGVPGVIASNASCSIGVTYTPSNSNTIVDGKITVNSSATQGTNSYVITGSGATPVANLAAASTSFGSVVVGSYNQLSFSYQNLGNATAVGVYAYTTGAGLTVNSSSCGLIGSPITLAPNASCSITVRYSPGSVGSLTGGAIFVNSDASSGVGSLSLTGQGVQAQGALSPSSGNSVNYGSIAVGSNLSQTYVFQNTGTASATSTYAVLTGTDYSIGSNTCGVIGNNQTIAQGQTCSITVTFSPSGGGARNAALYVYSSAANSPSSLNLTGSGQVIGISDFGLYRARADGTFAETCNAYRNPTGAYGYTGATGSGLYRVNPGGAKLYVYCDMDTAGGGWMLVGRSGVGNSTQIGWFTTGGSNSGTDPYSLGVLNYDIPFSQVMFGGGGTSPSNSAAPYIYVHNVSRATLLNYTGSMFYLSAPSPVSGSYSFSMAAYMGYSAYDGFFFRDCCGYAGYGLFSNGWATAYGDGTTDIQGQGANAAYGGYLNNRHGAIFVR